MESVPDAHVLTCAKQTAVHRSLKDLVKTLNGALSVSVTHLSYTMPDDVFNVIQTYLNRHVDIDGHDSARLHEELLTIHASRVQGVPEKLGIFLACFRALRPAILGVDELSKWWDILVKPTFDSMGQTKAIAADARAIVLSVLAYDEDDDPTGQKAQASSVFTDKLFEIFLEKTKLTASSDRGAGIREEQKQRFVSDNVQALLLAYGKRKPKTFLGKVDAFIIQKESRLQILGLLCSYVRLQGPHLYQVLQTPLLDHLLQCLENDTSTTVISLALTVLIMFMPHLCNALGAYLPRLFVVYTRVLCWDKFGVVRLDEHRFPGMDAYSRTGTPLSTEKHEDSINDDGWQKLNSSFETATSTTPDVGDYFSFLYGLYPINFLSFIREPYKFLERANYQDIDLLDIEEETIRQRTELYRQCHTLHPNFLTLTAETELSDQSRWMRVEPADVTAQCIGLVNNNVSFGASRPRQKSSTRPTIPESLIPTEDIPNDSLLSQGDEYPSNYDDGAENDWPEDASSAASNDKVLGLFQRRHDATDAIARTPPSRGPKAPDSPTIPSSSFGITDESHVQDMLNLQEQLQASFHDLKRSEELSSPTVVARHPSGPPPGYPGSATASPRLGAYMQSLDHSNMPRSPALRPAPSDTQGTIAYLQREVMLLKNDLNFERYLKQQHLSHIGHLQRKHIKESTAEAETQNLINTNKTLKAKLEEAKKAYAASRQEALKSKNQAKKWEAELSTKIRALREEQKAWRQDEEATKKALEAAREEADHLRKLLEDSEAEGLRSRQKLQSLNGNIEEVNKLRTFVDHLSNKLTDYDAKAQEFEMQRHSEENAIRQMERMKLKIAARDQDAQKLQRAYEDRILELESRISPMPNPVPPPPSQAFQGMIDSALLQANSRLASLKKAHNHLLQKYTELEIKYIELQAQSEIDTMRNPMLPQSMMHSHYAEMASDGESSHPQQHGHNIDPYQKSGQYQPSDDSMSPHSSFNETPNGQYSSMRDYRPRTASSAGQLPPGGGQHQNYSSHGGHSSPEPMHQRGDYFDHQRQLRRQPSMSDSIATATMGSGSGSGGTTISDDARSMGTIKSSNSSERTKTTIKPGSEVRVRGRGGEFFNTRLLLFCLHSVL